MKVKVANRIYQMGRKEYEKLLNNVAKKEVPFGIYAIEKKGYAELRNDKCENILQLKKMRHGYEYENRG